MGLTCKTDYLERDENSKSSGDWGSNWPHFPAEYFVIYDFILQVGSSFFVHKDRGGFLHLQIGEMCGTIQNLLKNESTLFT